MRHILRFSVAMVCLFLATTATQAQQPPRGGGGGGAGGFGGFGGGFGGGGGFSLKTLLVSNKALQDELKISDDLKEKFTKFTEAQRAEMEKLQGMGNDDEAQIARLKVQIKMIEDRMALMKGLSSEQTKRLTQIERQQMGLRAFSDEKIVKELNLTDAQKEKVKAVNEDYNKDQRELFSGGGFGSPETQKKLTALREEAMDKIEESLTQAQRKQWKEMVGEKFDTSKLFGGFGGAGGGNRRPPGGNN